MGKDLEMWEIFVIIARHILTKLQDYMYLLTDASNGNNENFQKYKFEGPRSHQKEIAPMWDMIAPLAEKYYGISPYDGA